MSASLTNHKSRYNLTNELHARPFPEVDTPSIIGYLAFINDDNTSNHFKILSDLLSRYGALPAQKEASHYFCTVGSLTLKWEKHTEFVTYTLIKPITTDPSFETAGSSLFPADWLTSISAKIITSISMIVTKPETEKNVGKTIPTLFLDMFVQESLSASYILDKSAIIATDFRIDSQDHIRFCIIPIGQTGQNRLGRIVQRLVEIETYKIMAMRTLPIARTVFEELQSLDAQLSKAVKDLSSKDKSTHLSLEILLSISAKIEALNAQNAYRFSAGEAYSSLVNHRISVLREERFLGYQLFKEFMMRRFHPAMRTCQAASTRLADISRRAARASDLLSTRVNVRQNAQTRQLLARMDERADIQLRLQETVEGLSIVAISYYAVSLLSYLLYPVVKTAFHIDKYLLSALLVIPVFLSVAISIRRIRNKLQNKQKT